VVPGPISEGNSYRCELSGLIGIISMVTLLCQHHHLTQGSIRIACDNINTLYIFRPNYIPNPTKDSFDLVSCLLHLIQGCPIRLYPEHVRGHQADKKARHFLSRTEQLNDEMDQLAKEYWQHKASALITPLPPIFSVAHEGWSIWHRSKKLPDAQTNRLYPLIEDAHALLHWTKPHTIQPTARLQPTCIRHIDFQACQAAMQSLKTPHRHWITKHASENCSVGTTFKAWGKQSVDRCPRCDQPGETSLHVLLCRAEEADNTWNANLSDLISYMIKRDTHPDLLHITQIRLHQLRNQEQLTTPGGITPISSTLIRKQDAIGWINLLYGFPSKMWQLIQARHIRRLNIEQYSVKSWMTGFIKRLQKLARGQWEHRNSVLYDPDKKWQRKMKQLLDEAITNELLRGPMDLPPGDRSHFSIPLLILLQRPWHYKKAWLANVSAARNRQARRRSQSADAIASSRARSSLLQFIATGQLPGRASRPRQNP
jgi:hypothetical protein